MVFRPSVASSISRRATSRVMSPLTSPATLNTGATMGNRLVIEALATGPALALHQRAAERSVPGQLLPAFASLGVCAGGGRGPVLGSGLDLRRHFADVHGHHPPLR